MPQLGDTRVNSTEYREDIVIEQFSYWGSDDEPSWAVPAWEERGDCDLSGPFASHAEAAEAAEALRRYEEMWGA